MSLPARIKGYIKDAADNGIAGATVTCGDISVKTIPGGTYLLTVNMNGVQKVTGSISGKVPVTVLVPVTPGVAVTAPDIILV